MIYLYRVKRKRAFKMLSPNNLFVLVKIYLDDIESLLLFRRVKRGINFCRRDYRTHFFYIHSVRRTESVHTQATYRSRLYLYENS